MYVGKRIRERREELKMSQDELAKKVGLASRSAVSKVELGKRDISQSAILKYAAALDVSPSWLLGFENKNGAPNELLDEVSMIMSKLSESGRQSAVEYLRFLVNKEV